MLALGWIASKDVNLNQTMDAWKIQSSKKILLCLYGYDLFKKKVFSLSKYRKIIPPFIL